MTTSQSFHFSDRLNEKKFMHRGEDDMPNNESEYGVSYVTILHELQKTYVWKKSFGAIKKVKEFNAIDVDTVKLDSSATVVKSSFDESRKSQLKKSKEMAPKKSIQNQSIKEKREFTHSLKQKSFGGNKNIRDKSDRLIKNMN